LERKKALRKILLIGLEIPEIYYLIGKKKGLAEDKIGSFFQSTRFL
jgi:hypothetical protein